MKLKFWENNFVNYVLKNVQSILGLRPTINMVLITTFVTPSFKAKTKFTSFMCVRIKFDT
jgi:hypothetical protein